MLANARRRGMAPVCLNVASFFRAVTIRPVRTRVSSVTASGVVAEGACQTQSMSCAARMLASQPAAFVAHETDIRPRWGICAMTGIATRVMFSSPFLKPFRNIGMK